MLSMLAVTDPSNPVSVKAHSPVDCYESPRYRHGPSQESRDGLSPSHWRVISESLRLAAAALSVICRTQARAGREPPPAASGHCGQC
jgi:hypothetical protein